MLLQILFGILSRNRPLLALDGGVHRINPTGAFKSGIGVERKLIHSKAKLVIGVDDFGLSQVAHFHTSQQLILNKLVKPK